MTENYDFEIVPSSRNGIRKNNNVSRGVDKLASVTADNFDRIMDMASAFAEIQKMQMQADVAVSTLREKRLMLEAETSAYVNKLRAETDASLGKLEVVRCMMNDYYHSNNDRLSGEEFSRLILDVLDRLETNEYGYSK